MAMGGEPTGTWNEVSQTNLCLTHYFRPVHEDARRDGRLITGDSD
jgi:hypothetical protein